MFVSRVDVFTKDLALERSFQHFSSGRIAALEEVYVKVTTEVFTTHMDTVQVGEGWTRNPFGGSVENGRVYGRGAADAKGALACFLAAMEALKSGGARLRGQVLLAAVVDEETASLGTRGLVRDLRCRYVIVGEPTLGRLVNAGQLTYGVAATFPPFEYQRGNDLVGFDIEMGQFLSDLFFRGAVMTLVLTLISEFGGIAIGFVLALAQTTRLGPLGAAAKGYIWLFRGTPALLQLIFVYNALPQIGIRFSGFESAVIALSMNEGAYMAEIIRSGIEAVSKGQRAAARALGMREWQVMRYVVLPQAVRVIIPPVSNQFIGMLKLSALVSVIGVTDLLLTAQQVASANFEYVDTLTAAAIYYLLLTTIFTVLQGWAEARMDISRRRRPVLAEYR